MITTRPRPISDALFAEAQQLLPGGVNSPVRAFRSVGGGTPVVMERTEGALVWDADGHRYIDYVCSWGPTIVGHAHPAVVEAVQRTASQGLTFGAPCALENELARRVIDRVPSIDVVRFVSSGTEAVMSAIRLARAYTKRPKLIKFEGCYHGHADSLLVKAGSGALSLGTPDSAGITPTTASDTLTAQFNQLDSVHRLLQQHPHDVAAVLVEPIAGNMGCVPPVPGFLEGLRELCSQYGALLIFDEVMTGFRVHRGGAQARYNVMPDITTLGKVLGGGLPVGAYGASREIMETVAPLGPMYQAGTLSGNPLGMAAGIATLDLLDEAAYTHLEAVTQQLCQGMASLATQHALPHTITQVGAMFSLFFVHPPVQSFNDIIASNRDTFNVFYWAMLNQGVYLAPSPFEAGFTCLAHTPALIDETLLALDKAFDIVKQF
ncbi:MAG: glutamate-1-semialdehyde 2,1-aminomutase [Vampirovibrionales bacterium]